MVIFYSYVGEILSPLLQSLMSEMSHVFAAVQNVKMVGKTAAKNRLYYIE
jgi:hypothetical protein